MKILYGGLEMVSKPIELFVCRTCDFWRGDRDLSVGKKEIICTGAGSCMRRLDKVKDGFSCREWKMWKGLMRHQEYLSDSQKSELKK